MEAHSCSSKGDQEAEETEVVALQAGGIFPPRGMLNKTISHYSNEVRLQGLYLTLPDPPCTATVRAAAEFAVHSQPPEHN